MTGGGDAQENPLELRWGSVTGEARYPLDGSGDAEDGGESGGGRKGDSAERWSRPWVTNL